MATYDAPYIYGEIPGEASNTPALRYERVKKLRTWFEDANWNIKDVGGRLTVETSSGTVFTPCLLGAGQDIFFQVGFTDSGSQNMIIFSGDSCFDDGTEKEETVELQNITYDIVGKEGSAGSSNGYVGWNTGSAESDIQATHTMIWKLVGFLLAERVDGGNIFYYGTESNGSGGYITTFGVELDAPVSWSLAFGGHLSTGASLIDGFGFIATSQDNRVSGNYMEVYVRAEIPAPVGPSRSNQVRFAMRVGARYSASTQHPLTIHFAENGDDDSEQIGLTTIDTIYGFVGPYSFYFDTPNTTSNLTTGTSIWGGAMRIKSLEGEIGDPLINKVLLLAGSDAAGSAGNPETFRLNALVIPGRSYIWCNAEGITERTFIGAAAKFSFAGYVPSVNQGGREGGIFWVDGTANMFEPWMAWNWVDPNTGSGDSAPLCCQIPNAIIPWRRLQTNGISTDNFGLYAWDGKLWRYFQTEYVVISGAGSPGTSLSFVVEDSKIFNGVGYTGRPMYDLESVVSASDPLPASGTTVLTITAAATQSLGSGGICIIRANNKRISFSGSAHSNGIVTFNVGSATAEITVTENGLGVDEIVRIEVIGTEGTITILNLLVLGS